MTRRAIIRIVVVPALAAAGFFMAAPAALAGKDCECIANGKRVKEGEVVCLRIGSAEGYLARCEMVLNNTSWKKLQDGCPTTALDASLVPSGLAMSPAVSRN